MAKERDEFTCPICGSHYFGTYNADDIDINSWIGYCKNERKRCVFTWKRIDDNKYFKILNDNK
jgi:hypothetical protein